MDTYTYAMCSTSAGYTMICVEADSGKNTYYRVLELDLEGCGQRITKWFQHSNETNVLSDTDTECWDQNDQTLLSERG